MSSVFNVCAGQLEMGIPSALVLLELGGVAIIVVDGVVNRITITILTIHHQHMILVWSVCVGQLELGIPSALVQKDSTAGGNLGGWAKIVILGLVQLTTISATSSSARPVSAGAMPMLQMIELRVSLMIVCHVGMGERLERGHMNAIVPMSGSVRIVIETLMNVLMTQISVGSGARVRIRSGATTAYVIYQLPLDVPAVASNVIYVVCVVGMKVLVYLVSGATTSGCVLGVIQRKFKARHISYTARTPAARTMPT